jgi:hypothetical protein
MERLQRKAEQQQRQLDAQAAFIMQLDAPRQAGGPRRGASGHATATTSVTLADSSSGGSSGKGTGSCACGKRVAPAGAAAHGPEGMHGFCLTGGSCTAGDETPHALGAQVRRLPGRQASGRSEHVLHDTTLSLVFHLSPFAKTTEYPPPKSRPRPDPRLSLSLAAAWASAACAGSALAARPSAAAT